MLHLLMKECIYGELNESMNVDRLMGQIQKNRVKLLLKRIAIISIVIVKIYF